MRIFKSRRAALVVAIAVLAPLPVAMTDTGVRADDVAETWVPRKSAVTPPVRNLPAMAYDRAREEVVLFGGYGPAGNNPQRTDTWTWNGGTWTQRFGTTPGSCPAPEMAYDASHANTVLFCGYSTSPGALGATWTWNGSSWTQKTTSPSPSPRQHYVLAYDETRQETVLFGGRSNNGAYLDDTWVWNGTSWSQRTPASSPPARSGAAAAYDALRSELVVFGGTGTSGPLTDTWVWNGTTWTQRATTSAPPPRWTATMAYDRVRTGAVLFGGVDVVTNAFLADTWTWNGAAWSEVTTVVAPPGRYFSAMAFDEARNQTVLHAGAVKGPTGGTTEADDTWTLDSAPGDCAPPDVPEVKDPIGLPVGLPDRPVMAEMREPDPCCMEAPTDAEGHVVLPPGATEVEEEDVSEDRGFTHDLYPNHDTTTDTWYDQVECPWSIGGEVPSMDGYVDLDQQLQDAGFTSSAPDVLDAIDRQNEELLLQVQRPMPQQMLDLGPIPGKCHSKTDEVLSLVPPDPFGVLPGSPPDNCYDRRTLRTGNPFEGRDVIYVHGFDPGAIGERLIGTPGFEAKWPQDPAAFASGGLWKERAKTKWRAHIQKYLGHDPLTTASPPPTNRYLVTSWASTQWMSYGVHAVLSQIAAAMVTGSEVVADSSGSTAGFCAQGCVVISQSTGGPITDIAMAVASGNAFSLQFSTLGNLSWISDRIDAHVAFAPAFGGSHYATVMSALGWAASRTTAMCELAAWVWQHLTGSTIPCSQLQVIADSVITDLAVPIMEAYWRVFEAQTPVPVLIVSTAHPTAMGRDTAPKALSPLAKMLFHHGFDDGVLSLDSQCAANGEWRRAPQSYSAKPNDGDHIVNNVLRLAGKPRISAARVYDMGNPDRAVRLYVDQVVAAHVGTPEYWKTWNDPIARQAHYEASMYRVASACVPYLSPTGMVQPVVSRTHPGTVPQQRLPNHFTFLMAASDHYTAGIGPYDTVCYEATFGSGRDCADQPNNREEVRVIEDPTIFTRGLVSPAIGSHVTEEVKGRTIKFRIFKKKFKWWKWKRTYHRVGGWQTKVAADYVYDYVLR